MTTLWRLDKKAQWTHTVLMEMKAYYSESVHTKNTPSSQLMLFQTFFSFYSLAGLNYSRLPSINKAREKEKIPSRAVPTMDLNVYC